MNNGNPGASVDGLIDRPRQSVEDVARQLGEYGITSRQSTVYELGGYRYTNAADAIAAARRGAR